MKEEKQVAKEEATRSAVHDDIALVLLRKTIPWRSGLMRLGGGKAIHPIGLNEESGAAERYTCTQLYLNKALVKLSVYLKRRRKRKKSNG